MIKVIKLENGQLEVAPTEQSARAGTGGTPAPRGPAAGSHAPASAASNGEREEGRGRRGRRGGRGRGRDRDRDGQHREPRPLETPSAPEAGTASRAPQERRSPAPGPTAQAPADDIGRSGERLTRDEAFDLVKRAAAALIRGDGVAAASAVRRKAHDLLGRDSESLSDRFFSRILRDAHDADLIDLRRRGDDFEVALPAAVAPVAEQLNRAAAAHAATPATPPPGLAVRGMGPRGIPARGRGGSRLGAPPPDLLSVGVVEVPAARGAAGTADAGSPAASESTAPAAVKGRARKGVGGGRGGRAKASAPADTKPAAPAEAKPAAKKKSGRAPRAKKGAEAPPKAS